MVNSNRVGCDLFKCITRNLYRRRFQNLHLSKHGVNKRELLSKRVGTRFKVEVGRRSVLKGGLNPVIDMFNSTNQLVIIRVRIRTFPRIFTYFNRHITNNKRSQRIVKFNPPCTIFPIVNSIRLSYVRITPLRFYPEVPQVSSSSGPASFADIFFADPNKAIYPS